MGQAGINMSLSQASFNTVIGNAIPCTAGSKGCSWELENWGAAGSSPRTTTRRGRRSSRPGPARTRAATRTRPTTPTSWPPTPPRSPLTQYENYLAEQLPVVYQPNAGNPITEIQKNLTGVDPTELLCRPSNRRPGGSSRPGSGLDVIEPGHGDVVDVELPTPDRRSGVGNPPGSSRRRGVSAADDQVPPPPHRPGARGHRRGDPDHLLPGPADPRRGGQSRPRHQGHLGGHRPLQPGQRPRPAHLGPVLAVHRRDRRPPQPGLLVQVQPGGPGGHRSAPTQDPDPGRGVGAPLPGHRHPARHPAGGPAQQADRLRRDQ